ncbi:hypothetical protein LshimejAT787_0409960 [Lyophyllum shimeji]|uniref:Integrase core domain-containing protein n=1 Tax=Lyophyllum shimeji TaxID=47721 RepID=A0A9P3UNK0_LYOSH|nr:hypothetical protein LshimejAT787_0409960 [Lyophyllum shimeji]
MATVSNNNPTGINQFKDCPKSDDTRVEEIMRDYDRRGIVSKKLISAMLLAEHGIKMSPRTVTRRRRDYKLLGAGATTRALPLPVKRQLVLDQLAQDPMSRQGPKTVIEGIALATGHHLTRSFVRSEMHLHDLAGFAIREPAAKKIHRGVLIALGPHHEWSGDGHDKLAAIGFPIWGVRDKYSGNWLGLWVVPNNRLKEAIALLFLKLIKEQGGMPIQMSTDCGSETTEVFGLANALREIFAGHISIDELPAHRFLKSVHNITIERGWLRLRLQWGDDAKAFWEAGADIYIKENEDHYNLAQWLWSTLIQASLDRLRDHFNNHVTRKDKGKHLPSGCSPHVALTLYAQYGAQNCLQRVDTRVVDALMANFDGEVLLFVTPEYAERAQRVYETLGIKMLTFQNVWLVFSKMLPLML